MAKHVRNLNRQQFLKELAQFAADQRRLIEAEVSGFPVDPAASRARRNQAWDSLEFFARTYFPHYVKHPNSVLHDYLYQRLPELVDAQSGQHDVIAAPRGEAKSTITSQIFVIWCVVTERKHYLCIVMDAFDQAATMLEAIKAELESNPRMAMDFPEVCGEGRVWQVGVVLTRNNRKVQAFGSGKRMRGLRHGPHRPDLVIADDLENDENVQSPAQRDKLDRWLKKTVLQLGDADGSLDVVVIGTVLHYDSVLSRLLANPLWRARRFQALLHWPHRMDLWDRLEEILLNQGEAEALAFYEGQRTAMDKGAVASWPAARPLVRLMIIRARDGHDTFDSELQNDPVSGEGAPFANCLQFWVNRLREWVFYGACDPSLGKFGASRDPSAILVGGFNRTNGILDVVEASIARRVPDRIIEDIIAYQREYACLIWAIENVQFQEFLRMELVRRSAERQIPVPARGMTPNTDKLLRIESLQPHMANGLIRLHPSQTTLIQQLRHFPKADHDDGPDCLHMLWVLARSQVSTTTAIRAGGRRDSVSLRGYPV